jgi:hypothetical protein
MGVEPTDGEIRLVSCAIRLACRRQVTHKERFSKNFIDWLCGWLPYTIYYRVCCYYYSIKLADTQTVRPITIFKQSIYHYCLQLEIYKGVQSI